MTSVVESGPKSTAVDDSIVGAKRVNVITSSLLPATRKGVSYSYGSIARALSKLGCNVELVVPYGSEKSEKNYRVTYTRPAALQLIPTSKLRYLVHRSSPGLVRTVQNRNEEMVLKRAKEGAANGATIAHIWPGPTSGHSLSLLRGLREAKIPTVREMINCHVGTAKQLMDAEFAKLGIRPAHGISAEYVDQETALSTTSDYIFCSNPLVEKSLVDHGVSEAKIVQTSFGWDPARYDGEERALKPSDGTTFLFVGTICVRKGAHLLLRYWAKSGIRGRLVLVGRMDPMIKSLCAEYLQRDDVVVVDFTSNIRAYYRSADVFVFPTIEEGGPMVTYEAGGLSLPLIVSPMGAARIADEATGAVLDPHDEDAWIETMRRLAKDGELRREMGSRAQRKAAKFVWSEVSKTRAENFRRISRTSQG